MINFSNADSVNELLQPSENSFVVPLYQRRYVWDNTNWTRIWKDIIDQVNTDPDQRGVGHFTGPIVTRSLEGYQKRYEVIDGQQRLTTLQIIFSVIIDLCSGVNELSNGDIVEDAEKHVLVGTDSHKLTLTKFDQTTFEKIVEKKLGKDIHTAWNEVRNELQKDETEKVISKVFGDKPYSLNILDAYKFFYEQIRIHIQKDRDNAEALLETISDNFKLIHLSLDEAEGIEAEKVFESINATGLMLSDFDYLRNNLFLRARILGTDSEGKLKRDTLYTNYWPFEENDWVPKKQQSFLRTFLKAAWDPECLDRENPKPFEAYRNYRDYSEHLDMDNLDVEGKIRYEFTQLSQWGASYQKLKENPTYKDYENFRKGLKLPDLDAFLLYVIYGDDKHFSVLQGCVSILQSYIMRNLLVRESPECTHADIKEQCYSEINTFFNSEVKNSSEFDLSRFTTHLKNESAGIVDLMVQTAFIKADDKNAHFIIYILNRIGEMDTDPRTLKVTDISILPTAIQNQHNDMNGFLNNFNRLWPNPF